MLASVGKTLILMGLIFLILGGVFVISGKIPLLGRLPGDIQIQKKSFGFYFPIGTSIVLSIILSILLSVILVLYNLFKK